MSLSSKFRLRTIAVAAMTLGLLAGTATVASATYEESGDDRATAYPRNVKMCDDPGVGGGEKLSKDDFTFVIRPNDDDEGTYLDIATVAPDVTVTAIVIKGGRVGYNVYDPAGENMSDTPPWLDLHAPLNPSGKPAAISHWFVCGEKDDETTTTETTTTTSETSETSTPPESTTTDESTTTSDSAPATTPTTSATGGAPMTTTTEAPVAPAGQNDDLASTGFGSGWLIGLGALLLAGGAALLFLARMRRGKA